MLTEREQKVVIEMRDKGYSRAEITMVIFSHRMDVSHDPRLDRDPKHTAALFSRTDREVIMSLQTIGTLVE